MTIVRADVHDSKNVVDQIDTQLERLEHNAALIQVGLRRLQASDTYCTSSSKTEDINTRWSCAFLQVSTSNEAGAGVRHGNDRRMINRVDGWEVYCGPIPMPCLICDAQELIPVPMLRVNMVQGQEATTFVARFEALSTPVSVGVSDKMLPAMPPMAILEAMFEPYFEEINPTFPLWTHEGLRARISSPQAVQTACVISTNMILLTLTARFDHPIAKRTSESPPGHSSPSLESELVKPFAINARRAAKNLDRFLAPRIEIVQTLLSLVRLTPFF